MKREQLYFSLLAVGVGLGTAVTLNTNGLPRVAENFVAKVAKPRVSQPLQAGYGCCEYRFENFISDVKLVVRRRLAQLSEDCALRCRAAEECSAAIRSNYVILV
jgi:hypothetical protein